MTELMDRPSTNAFAEARKLCLRHQRRALQAQQRRAWRQTRLRVRQSAGRNDPVPGRGKL